MKYEIYQLKEDTMEQMKLRFMASDQAAALGGIHRENYRLVYEGNVETRKDAQQTLDGLFRRFNIDRPTGFEGHSLSVSDIIYLADGESSGWWFCDAYGWKLLSGEEWGADLMRHYTKAEWDKIPEAYKGRWEPTPFNLERVKSGELPAEYIGKRNTIVNDEHRGTVLITEGAHFVIDK